MSPRLNECFASQNGPSAMIERGSSTVRADRNKFCRQPSLRCVVFSVRFLLWALGTIQRQGGKAARHVISEEAVFNLSRARKNPDSCGILWTNTWWSDFYLELMLVFVSGFRLAGRGTFSSAWTQPGQWAYFSVQWNSNSSSTCWKDDSDEATLQDTYDCRKLQAFPSNPGYDIYIYTYIHTDTTFLSLFCDDRSFSQSIFARRQI